MKSTFKADSFLCLTALYSVKWLPISPMEGGIDMFKHIDIKVQYHTSVNSPVGTAQNKLTNQKLVSIHINVKTLGYRELEI